VAGAVSRAMRAEGWLNNLLSMPHGDVWHVCIMKHAGGCLLRCVCISTRTRGNWPSSLGLAALFES
jgi:hypothetical protein